MIGRVSKKLVFPGGPAWREPGRCFGKSSRPFRCRGGAGIDNESDQVKEGHSVDALALRGDEGRGTLRKVTGSREQALIRESPNGATHPATGIVH